jgi:hypothetical protein
MSKNEIHSEWEEDTLHEEEEEETMILGLPAVPGFSK